MTRAHNHSRLLAFLVTLLFGLGLFASARAQVSPAETSFNNAHQLFLDNRLTEAFAAFQQYEIQNKFSTTLPQAIFFQGSCEFGLHQYQPAIDSFNRLAKNYPADPLVPNALLEEADGYGELKNYPKALTLYRQFEALYPKHALMPQARLGEAGILLKQNNLKAARDIAENVIAQFPTNTTASLEAQFLLGETLFNTGRYADAITYYKRVQSNPDLSPTAVFRIANCQQLLGQTHQAAATYHQFLATYPDDKLAEQARLALIQVLSLRREHLETNSEAQDFQKKYPNSSFTVEVLFLQAESLFAAGQFQDALDRFQKFATTNKNPQLQETAKSHIAACYYGLHDFNKARDGFTAFLKQYPNSRMLPDVLFRLGRSYFAISQQATDPVMVQTNLASAASNYEQLRTRFTTNELVPEVTFQLGYLYTYLGSQNVDKAIAVFQEFVNRWPDNPLVPEALYQIGRNEKPPAAITAYQQLVDKYPRNELAPHAIHELALNDIAVGDALLRQQQFTKARDVFQKALARNPTDAQTKRLAQIGFANACLAMNQLNDAESSFKQILAADPQNTAAELGLAKVDLARGSPGNEQAVDLLNKVVADSKGQTASEATFLLGNYFFNLPDNQKDNKKAALVYYLRAALLMSGPRGEEAAFRTGQCHQVLGNDERARSAFQAYLRRFPEGQFAANAKQELAALPPIPPQP